MSLDNKKINVFAENGVTIPIGSYDKTKATKDSTLLQASNLIEQGFKPLRVHNQTPALEHFNTLYHLLFKQHSYVQKNGILEYLDTVNYKLYAFVKSGESLYLSLKADNKGNPLTNTVSWKLIRKFSDLPPESPNQMPDYSRIVDNSFNVIHQASEDGYIIVWAYVASKGNAQLQYSLNSDMSSANNMYLIGARYRDRVGGGYIVPIAKDTYYRLNGANAGGGTFIKFVPQKGI